MDSGSALIQSVVESGCWQNPQLDCLRERGVRGEATSVPAWTTLTEVCTATTSARFVSLSRPHRGEAREHLEDLDCSKRPIVAVVVSANTANRSWVLRCRAKSIDKVCRHAHEGVAARGKRHSWAGNTSSTWSKAAPRRVKPADERCASQGLQRRERVRFRKRSQTDLEDSLA